MVCFLKGKACNVFGNHIIITVNLLEGRLLFLSLINLVVLVNQSSNKIFIGNEIIYNLYNLLFRRYFSHHHANSYNSFIFFLFRLKDIAQNDKFELSNVTKLNKELSQQVSSIGSERDKLKERLQEATQQVDDLKEQVENFSSCKFVFMTCFCNCNWVFDTLLELPSVSLQKTVVRLKSQDLWISCVLFYHLN